MQKKQPKDLEPGDKVAIICPSGQIEENRIQHCIDQLRSLNLDVVIGHTIGTRGNYFSGTDEERLSDLQTALDDKTIKAIIFGRGGYGLSRIIDKIDLHHFKKHPKWVVGYSDITLLHTHINRHTSIATIHGPMAGSFDSYPTSEYPTTIFPAMMGTQLKYKMEPHELNHIGTAQGSLIGGNLCLLAHSIGTSSEPETKGKILFIEEVGEYIYAIDRLFLQLKRAGWLDKINGLIVGSFSDTKDTTKPFGMHVYQAINHHLSSYNFPVAFDFPIGHTERNVALKIGTNYKLSVKTPSVVLKEK